MKKAAIANKIISPADNQILKYIVTSSFYAMGIYILYIFFLMITLEQYNIVMLFPTSRSLGRE